MNLEDTLKQTFESRLEPVEVSAGDVAGARAAGRRLRVRRRVAAGLAAAAVVAAGVAGTLVSTHPSADAPPAGGPGRWQQIAPAPLSPRAFALAAWTGREVVVVGGTAAPCPPTADCGLPGGAALRDGAAYDPATNTWHPIARAPEPIANDAQVVVADGRVVVRTGGRDWWIYDPEGDTWETVPADAQGYWLSALGPRVYTPTRRGIAYLDVRTSAWVRLPPDPIRPRLTSGTVTATTSGPVVAGYDATQPNDGVKPSLVLADIWDGTAWRRLPPSDQLEGAFAWTGRRMVDPTPFTENGGEVDGWGRDIPQGGTLDPATGKWGRLPGALTGDPDGWSLSAQGGAWFAVAGQVYDDDTRTVSTLPRPDGAPDYGVTGAWADGRLLAFGGTDSSQGYSGAALTNHAWLYTP